MRKGGDDDAAGDNLRGKTRSDETHESSTEPDSRLFRESEPACELRFMGHTLIENRNGLVVNARVRQADGYAEREAAQAMMADARRVNPKGEITLCADKGCDAAEFIQAFQDRCVRPHAAQNKAGRASAVPDEIAASEGYALSPQKRASVLPQLV